MLAKYEANSDLFTTKCFKKTDVMGLIRNLFGSIGAVIMMLTAYLLQNILMERKFIRILHYRPEIIYAHCKKDSYPRLFSQHNSHKVSKI